MAYENIPAELKALKQWCVWRMELTDTGKPTKVPYDAVTGYGMSTTDPRTWRTFDEAVACAMRGHNGGPALDGGAPYNGIGFCFALGDPYCGIDLDVKAETDQETFDLQRRIGEAMNSYTEFSPSGMGLHIIVKARVPAGRKRNSVEVYSDGRYFTFTGNVFHNAPIEDRQSLVMTLWEEMGASAQHDYQMGKLSQDMFDDDMIEHIKVAANGEKFWKLFTGDWQHDYGSQSSADQALMNFLAHYSGHRGQMARIFLLSALGQRDKAKRDKYIDYTMNRAFDQMLPPIDMDTIISQVNAAIAQSKQESPHLPGENAIAPKGADVSGEAFAPSLPNIVDGFDLDYWRRVDPPRLLSQMMYFVMAQAQYPVREIALTASLGMLAGIVGRSHNISATGLNLYLMILAATGRGKEAMSSGVDRMFDAVANQGEFPAIQSFRGPRDAASGSGLSRYLSEMPVPSCIAITGEIGIRLKAMSSKNASASEEQLKGTLLELFTKSGANLMYMPRVHADKKNNIEGIRSPAFTWVGEGVPSTFYNALTEEQIAEGLIPRFLTIEYTGIRVEYNEHHERATVPYDLIHSLKTLGETSLSANQQNKVVTVGTNQAAAHELTRIRQYVDAMMNKEDTEVIAQLWNRHHLKVLKLSALLAIAHNHMTPEIDVQMVVWANSLCMNDTLRLKGKFERGEVGGENATFDSEQMKLIKKHLAKFLRAEIMTSPTVALYRANAAITRTMISQGVASYKAFREDKQGLIKALDKCLGEFVTNGVLSVMSHAETTRLFNSTAKTYVFANATAILTD